MDSWLAKSIVGFILSIVGGVIIYHLTEGSRTGGEAERAAIERRLHNARQLELQDERRRLEAERKRIEDDRRRPPPAPRAQQQQPPVQPQQPQPQPRAQQQRPACEPFVQVCGSLGCLREPNPNCR